MALTVGTQGVLAQTNTYAKAVVASQVLLGNVGNKDTDPTAALGAPDGRFLAMGGPGATLILDMGADTPIIDQPGPDIEIREIGAAYGNGSSDESHRVFVSNSPEPESFIEIGTGRAISLLDIHASGLASARYIRLVDIATESLDSDTPGSDIDSVCALHYEGAGVPMVQSARVIPTGQGLLLRWDASSATNLTEYNIRRSSDGVTFDSSANVSLSALETAWLDTSVTRVTNIWYAISAKTSAGESSFVVVSASTSALAQGPSSPAHLGDDPVATWETPACTNFLQIDFDLDAAPAGHLAELEMDVFNVDYASSPILLNGALLGTVPTQSAEAWQTRRISFAPAHLLAGHNTLRFYARDSAGGTTSGLDDFMIRNLKLNLFNAPGATPSAQARITSIHKNSDGTVSLQWVVEQSPAVQPAQWQPASDPISGTNWTGQATGAARYYRLRAN